MLEPNPEQSSTEQDYLAIDTCTLSNDPLSCLNDNVIRTLLSSIDLIGKGPYALVVIGCQTRTSQYELADSLEKLKLSMSNAFVEEDNGRITVLTRFANAFQLCNCINESGKEPDTSCAVSLPFDDANEISRQYQLVDYCLTNIEGKRIIDAHNWVVPFLKAEFTNAFDYRPFLHPAIAKLSQYDELNQSNLLHTLKVYLDYDRNAQQCANALYLHRNSLQYRIRRIQEIAGVNLDDPEERAYLRLSLFLMR